MDRRPVGERIREALPHTLLLNGVALILALAIAVPLGVVAGGHPEGALDRVSGVALFALYSTPTFWMALLLQSLFAVQLGWLPLYGVASDPAPSGLAGLVDRLAHVALPATCLAYGTLAFVARLVRSGVAETREADYVLAARARGASRRRALWTHAFPNAILPLLTLFGLLLPALLSGSVIVERIFAWPGLGRLFFDSILARDYPVILGLSLLSAVATLGATLALRHRERRRRPARPRRDGDVSARPDEGPPEDPAPTAGERPGGARRRPPALDRGGLFPAPRRAGRNDPARRAPGTAVGRAPVRDRRSRPRSLRPSGLRDADLSRDRSGGGGGRPGRRLRRRRHGRLVRRGGRPGAVPPRSRSSCAFRCCSSCWRWRRFCRLRR